MTEKTQPTDNDLDVFLAEHWPAFATVGTRPLQWVRAAMRDAIAKWGTPSVVAVEPVAWRQGSLTTVNQDPYPSLGDWFVQFWEGDDVAARVYGNDMETLRRRCAVIATPQPTQAQAGAVPLTDEQIDAAAKKLAECMEYPWEFMPEPGRKNMRKHAQDVIDAAHGIKGGQHGAE